MRLRLSKTRITDYRPPNAGGKPPLERNARPGAVACTAPIDHADKANHDKWVVTLSNATLLAAARHIGATPISYSRDPESIWKRNRLAALAREIDRRHLNRPPSCNSAPAR